VIYSSHWRMARRTLPRTRLQGIDDLAFSLTEVPAIKQRLDWRLLLGLVANPALAFSPGDRNLNTRSKPGLERNLIRTEFLLAVFVVERPVMFRSLREVFFAFATVVDSVDVAASPQQGEILNKDLCPLPFLA
jgi:hypothetical protein